MAVISASAQSAGPDGSQSVLFSSPVGNSQLSPANIPVSRSDRLNLGNQIQAPHSLFNQAPPDNSMTPMPAPPMNALRQMMQEKKKNWTEMTPEEIFGLKPPQKDDDSKKLDTSRNDTFQSPLERFLMQQRLAQTGTTNFNSAIAPSDGWNFLDPANGLPNQQRLEKMRNGSIASSQIFNRWLQNAQDSPNNSQQNQDDAWMKVFTAPRVEQQSPAQLADMEAFRAMLQSESPAANFKNSSAGAKPFASSLPMPDSNFEPQRAGYNPAGASFIPLDSGIARPKRLAPLPTLTSSGLPTPTIAPSWAPKPPPWTVEGPQLFVIPTRKF